jgi:hypothetical protein
LIVVATLGVFAYYVASGNFALVPAAAPDSPRPIAETSSSRVELTGPIATDGTPFQMVNPSGETSTFVAEMSSATVAVETEPEQAASPVVEAAAPAVVQNTSPAPDTAPQPVVSAPAPAPAASAPAAAPAVAPELGVVERWRSLGIMIETQGQEWDEQSLANVDAALSALPAGVRSKLGNPALGPLHILVNTQGRALSGKQPYGGAANYFATGDGVNELVMYPRQRVSTILHELGHAYNLRRVQAGHYAKVLIDAEMESFLAATGWQVLATREQIAQSVDHMRLAYDYKGAFRWPEVSKFDPLEDFANSFAMYFYDGAGLQAQSPERFGWMAANLPR